MDLVQQFLAQLSEQEKKVVLMIADGKTNQEIAADLNISYGTVKNYIHNIFTKTNIKDRREIIILINKLMK